MLILLQKGDNEVQQEIQSHRMNSPSEWPIHTIRNREVTKLGATLSLANIRNLSVIEFADFRNPLLGCRSPFCFAAQATEPDGMDGGHRDAGHRIRRPDDSKKMSSR
ncbi:MAG: hypothetical protein DWI21_16720 [Planctomycetota bacterium]|nr:MAG: hypothetical protein DWI21_16720 [Planctomycetota bacterium]GDY08624.1 hypothetical protein LBMAG52_21100 [Planctomycetia bacterium]